MGNKITKWKSVMPPQKKLKLIMSNPKIYIESFMKITDKTGKLVPFKLNHTQIQVFKNAKKYNQILKSRQAGCSVSLLARALYYCLTQPNTHCMMLSHNMESTRNVFNKAKQLYDSIPDVVKPKLIKNNRQELGFTNGSILSCATMGKKDNGRGATLKFIHVSELAFVGEQAKKQLLALEQALRPDGELWIESTANGMGNYYHELWNKSTNKENAYNSMFFSYLDSEDMFKDDHKQALDLFERLNGRSFTESDLTDEEKDLIEFDARHTLGIICWRRFKIGNSSVEEFNQEFPLTPEMAFVSTGSSIFSNAKIQERIKHVPKPLKTINHELLKQFIKQGLSVFELPESGHKYSIGVDGSEGLGGNNDYSSISVYDCETFKEVAHFRNNKIAPHKFAELVHEMALFYNYGLLVVEKASAGVVVLDKLRHDWNYRNIYKSKQFDERGQQKKKIGFVTTDKTRPILINGFREAFEEGEILVNSVDVLKEMLTFHVDVNGKAQHMKGSHDDSLFATMFAVFGLSQSHYK